MNLKCYQLQLPIATVTVKTQRKDVTTLKSYHGAIILSCLPKVSSRIHVQKLSSRNVCMATNDEIIMFSHVELKSI